MSRRIDIELTSALDDGTWTWRAAGARQPRGVLDGSILDPAAKVGDELKVEIEQEIDGITVLNVVHGRGKQERTDVIELLPAEREFQPVVETRAKRDPSERRGRDGDRRPRRDRGDRGGRRGDAGAGRGGEGRDGGRRREGGPDGGRDGGRDRGRDGGRDGGRGRRGGPSFTPPPEVPQRPKPKRLRPGKQHRNEVLADLPEEQRPIAELTLQGMGAVRQRLREENEKAAAEGRALMPEASVMKMAEELLPKLRVAEWRDRAEAAQRQIEHLDLRDLRSVVAAAGDPMVARDESTGELVEALRAALARKQEEELLLWFGDVDAALAVGRVIRALRLSSQPPKAGVPFPTDIAQRLVDSANASLAPMDSPERWAAMLEAAAFSPVHAQIKPTRKPDVVDDELLATVKRLAPALPHVAALFDIEVDPSAPMPKPLRPGPRKKGKSSKGGSDRPKRDRDDRGSDRGSDRGKRRRDDRPAADAAGAGEPAPGPRAHSPSAPGGEPAETPTAAEPHDGASAAPAPEPTAPEPTATSDPTTEPNTTEDPAPTATEPAASTTTEDPAPDSTEPAATEPAASTTTADPASVGDAPAVSDAEPSSGTVTPDDDSPTTA